MNYFYFFFFIFLGILVWIKPFAEFLKNKILSSNNINVIASITILIGLICVYAALTDGYWFERVWRIVTFSLGIILIIRGIAAMFFFNQIKKAIPFVFLHYFKFMSIISVMFFTLAFFVVSSDYVGPQKDISNCSSDNKVKLICDFKNPEDIVITPDKKFLFMSEFGGIGPYEEQKSGYFALLNLETKTKVIPDITIEKNIWGNPECTRTSNKKYGPHGIDLIKRNDGRYQLGVINHYPDETIEMFEMIKKENSWDMVWRGCIDVPYEFYFNDISLRKSGSFYASHMYDRDITLNEWLFVSIIKTNTGFLVEWIENKFKKIDGSDGSGPNGIALDEDSNIIYINYNQGDSITKFDLSLNKKLGKKFIEAPDNPYIDGNDIWITSLDFQPNDFGDCEFKKSCSLPFSIYQLDKNNLEIKNEYSFSKTVFGLPTVAVPIEDEVFLGSFHSDRLGIIEIN